VELERVLILSIPDVRRDNFVTRFHRENRERRYFQSKIRNGNLHGISNDNVIRVVNFAALKKPNCQQYNVPLSQNS